MLYIVSVPIGNLEDITRRALRILSEADAVVCEETREGARLLHSYQIENELIALNEHNERERIPELIERMRRGQTFALVSDHGTPLLADPGERWIEQTIANGIPVSPVPGASSLLSALVVSGFSMKSFRFAGMLPVKKDERRKALEHLKNERETWVIFDAPYRLPAVLADIRRVVGADRRMVIACNLTMPTENIIRGTAGYLVEYFEKKPFKGEYVIVVAGTQSQSTRRDALPSRRLNT